MSDVDVVEQASNEVRVDLKSDKPVRRARMAEESRPAGFGRALSYGLNLKSGLGRGTAGLPWGLTNALSSLGRKAATRIAHEDGAPTQWSGFLNRYAPGLSGFLWLPTVMAEDPEVLMFQEGDQGPARSGQLFGVPQRHGQRDSVRAHGAP